MHHPIWLVALLGACGLACGDAQPGDSRAAALDPAPRPRAVVLIVVDTLRADRLSLYGHDRDTSPHLVELARSSTVYRRAYSVAPWTMPSIGSLLSSRYPSESGIVSFGSRVPEDLVLLPERLREAGYATSAVISHELVSQRLGFGQGFDLFDESHVQGPLAVTSDGISDLALRLVEEHADEPFFLFLHYFDPHYAYTEHADFPFERGDYRGWFRSGMTLFDFVAPDQPGLDAADIAEVKRVYDSEIAFTDRAIGRVLDGLRERGLFDDALVIVTADHGEEFLDHGALNHTKTLYEELVHVPLVIHYPGQEAAVVETPVGLIDVYPTVLDTLGLARGSDLRGRSLRGLMETAPPRPLFLETTFGQNLDDERRVRRLRAVVLGDHKLIVEAGDEQHPARHELYDLSTDPQEGSDLGAEHPALGRLAPLLARWIEANQLRESETVEIDEDQRSRLEALGYH